MTPPPPASTRTHTPFPYTSLFRSHPEINTIAIVTRHNSHASMVEKVLAAGKHVFVEKPLALHVDEIDRIEQLYQQQSTTDRYSRVMVRSEEPTSELQSLMRNSYAVCCLKNKKHTMCRSNKTI